MQIHGLNKTTLLDYPGHVAATIFTGGCNFRCPFCHNSSLVLNPSSIPALDSNEILSFLNKRKNILSGVCITGGEPTLHHDLPDFISDIKKLGYLVKLDTNGTNPDMIITLFEKGLLDYVAMDIKSSKESYFSAAGITSFDISNIESSISYLIARLPAYEFRTTVVDELHSNADMLSLAKWISGSKAYFLQPYKDSPDTISDGYHSPSKEKLDYFINLIKPHVPSVAIRGVD